MPPIEENRAAISSNTRLYQILSILELFDQPIKPNDYKKAPYYSKTCFE